MLTNVLHHHVVRHACVPIPQRSLFERYGLPDPIVSDNGPQFIADEFKTFCKPNGVCHTTGAPHHLLPIGQLNMLLKP